MLIIPFFVCFFPFNEIAPGKTAVQFFFQHCKDYMLILQVAVMMKGQGCFLMAGHGRPY